MSEARQAAVYIMEKLENAGYQAYLVGGCVRDILLERIPNDYDLATDAKPTAVQKLFEKTIPTGIDHGTVTVLVDDVPVEVTTFRVEGEYKDGRRPEEVQFVKQLSHDLSRRDFTINAMAMDLRGKLYDYYDGKKDLQQKLIRAVGDAEKRFEEDALRMVRAIRFVAQFQFSLEEGTADGIRECRERAKKLPVERVTSELNKLWNADYPSIGIEQFWSTKLIHHTIPFGFWGVKVTPTPKQFQAFDLYKDSALRWAYLLYLLGASEKDLPLRLTELKLSKKESTKILSAFRLGLKWDQIKDDRELKKVLLQHGLEWVVRANCFANMIDPDHNLEQIVEIEKCWKEMPVKMLKELAIKGKDLVERIPKEPGPWVRETLVHLLEKVAFSEIENEPQALLAEGEQYVHKCSQ